MAVQAQEGFSIQDIQAALESAYDDERWLAVLKVPRHTGVADATQLREATGLSRGQLDRLLEQFEDVAPQVLLTEVPFPVSRPGKRGRPSAVYRLGKAGAALLRANGYDNARACGLNTETQIGHARAVLDVRLAAQADGLAVATERELAYTDAGKARVLRPDNLVTLSDGTRALFEVEQNANLSLLRRVRESVRHKLAFFAAPEAEGVSSHVRVLIDLPHGKTWDRTVAVWEQATAISAEEHGGHLPFHIAAIPLLDFLETPDWAEPPDEPRWESLFDPAQTAAFEPTSDDQKALVKKEQKLRQANIPMELKRRSARDDYLIMEAYWYHLCQEGRDLMFTHERPLAHQAFFDTMNVIYVASHPPDASPWERALHPHASLYLLHCYLEMHPRLRQALSKAVARGSSSTRWSASLVTHRAQVVIDTFLRYHGLCSGDALNAYPVGPWQRGGDRGDFGIVVDIEPQALMGAGDGVVPTREDVAFVERALAWVLFALFAYAEDIDVKRARFW